MSRLNDFLPKEGDTVTFHFSDGKAIFGKVLYVPSGPGSMWVIQTYNEGKRAGTNIIQTFERISINK